MANDAATRSLFDVGPADYVAERDRLTKQARADGDKAGAAAIKALKRPSLSMWAVLAAGRDDRAVHELVDATEQLAGVQGGGGDRGAIQAATRRRRDLVEALTDTAIETLRRYESSAPARRAEVRTMIDQLARHPELADAWIDGTLRDLPEAGSGFEAFAGMELPEPAPKGAGSPTTLNERRPSRSRTADETVPKQDPQDQVRARREDERRRKASIAEARQHLRSAKEDHARARRDVGHARDDLEKAADVLRQAEAAERVADEALTVATERIEALERD